jgi:hypothetical protein
MSKRKRILAWAAGFVLVLFAYGWLFGVTSLFAVQSRYIGWQVPVVRKTRLNWLTHRFHHSQVLSTLFSGFAFELPSSDIDESRSKTVGKIQVVTFRSGNAILIGDPGPREFASAVLEHDWDRETFTNLYGAEPLESGYKMYDLMLRTSLSSVAIFSGRKKVVANTMMLTIKAIAEPSGAATGVFASRTSRFKGFQYGDPSAGAKRITVDHLDDAGELELSISPKNNGPDGRSSQPQINRIIQSVRRISSSDQS